MSVDRLAPLVLLLTLAAGCAEDTLPVGGRDCWGAGAEACAGAPEPVRRALGGEDRVGPLVEVRCGELLDCAVLGGGAAAAVLPPSPTKRRATPRRAPPVAEPRALRACAIDDVIAAIEVTEGDRDCLREVASGVRPAEEAVRADAALALYGRRDAGWGPAVEATLGRPALSGLPTLNVAGVVHAASEGRHGDVLSRARVAWAAVDELDEDERLVLVEQACRSAGQVGLTGRSPVDGVQWCERWRRAASTAERDIAPAVALIGQLSSS